MHLSHQGAQCQFYPRLYFNVVAQWYAVITTALRLVLKRGSAVLSGDSQKTLRSHIYGTLPICHYSGFNTKMRHHLRSKSRCLIGNCAKRASGGHSAKGLKARCSRRKFQVRWLRKFRQIKLCVTCKTTKVCRKVVGLNQGCWRCLFGSIALIK